MIRQFNTFTVQDLKEMLTKIKLLDGDDGVPELIEIAEGFETAMTQYGGEEPRDRDRLHALFGLAWMMEQRMKKIELTLENIRIQTCLSPHAERDMSRMDVVHRVPERGTHEIVE